MAIIDGLGGIQQARSYLKWMEDNMLLMGSFKIPNGRVSFYDHNLRSEIIKYEGQ